MLMRDNLQYEIKAMAYSGYVKANYFQENCRPMVNLLFRNRNLQIQTAACYL